MNLTGSLLLGVLVGAGLGPTWGAALAVGFCGASTTWSTLALDVVALASERAWWSALLDLVASGRKVSEVAFDLEISDQTIHSWLRQDRIDRGLEPGLTTPERAELRAAKRRIAELEAELAIHRRASELLGKVVPPKGASRPSR